MQTNVNVLANGDVDANAILLTTAAKDLSAFVVFFWAHANLKVTFRSPSLR